MKVEISKNSLVRLTVAVAALLFSADAMAATQSITANISFDTPLSITNVTNISFGTVTAGSAATYTVSTAGAISVTAGSGQWLFGAPNAGSLKIAGSSTQTINIKVDGYTADHGVTPQNATCSYDGGATVPCTNLSEAGPGAGKVLLLGADVVVDGTQTAGTHAQPAFNVTVTYN